MVLTFDPSKLKFNLYQCIPCIEFIKLKIKLFKLKYFVSVEVDMTGHLPTVKYYFQWDMGWILIFHLSKSEVPDYVVNGSSLKATP